MRVSNRSCGEWHRLPASNGKRSRKGCRLCRRPRACIPRTTASPLPRTTTPACRSVVPEQATDSSRRFRARPATRARLSPMSPRPAPEKMRLRAANVLRTPPLPLPFQATSRRMITTMSCILQDCKRAYRTRSVVGQGCPVPSLKRGVESPTLGLCSTKRKEVIRCRVISFSVVWSRRIAMSGSSLPDQGMTRGR